MPVSLRSGEKGAQGVQSPNNKSKAKGSPQKRPPTQQRDKSPTKKDSAGSPKKKKLPVTSTIPKKARKKPDDKDGDGDPAYTSPSSNDGSSDDGSEKEATTKTRVVTKKGKKSGQDDKAEDEKETTTSEHKGPGPPTNEAPAREEKTPPPKTNLPLQGKEAGAKTELSESDESEAGMQEGNDGPQTPSPSKKKGSSFEELFPFVINRKGTPEKKNEDDSSRHAFVDTYGDFQEYMVGIKLNAKPAVAHRKSCSIIDIERDGTSSMVYAFKFHASLTLVAFYLGRGTNDAN